MSPHPNSLDELWGFRTSAVPALSPPRSGWRRGRVPPGTRSGGRVAMKQALGLGALAIAALVCTACQIFPRTLEVDKLEVGMKPAAVRALIGEPDWVEVGMKPAAIRALIGAPEPTEPAHSSPETWPEVQAAPSAMRATETWLYSDTLVYSWMGGVTERTTCLYFEDERLAEWSFGYGRDCAKGGATPGGEMVFDPQIEAYRVASCGPSAHGGHCAHYFHQDWFYRIDSNGWCRSRSSVDLFVSVEESDVPEKLAKCKCREVEINKANTEAIEAAQQEAATRITEIREAEKDVIRKANTEPDAGSRRAAIRAARREADSKIEAIHLAENETTQAAKKEADAKITETQRARTKAIRAAKKEANTKLIALRNAKKVAIWKAETAEIEAANLEADTKIKETREARNEAIHEAETATSGRTRRAEIKAAKKEAKASIETIRGAEREAIEDAKQEANTKITAIQGPQRKYRGGRGHRGGGGFFSGGGGGSSGGGSSGSSIGGGGGSSGGGSSGGGGGGSSGGSRGGHGGGGQRGRR